MGMLPDTGIDVENNLDMCFGCGVNNPIGLKLKFSWENNIASADYTPLPEHQGWNNVVHGGLVCTLLDEAMSYPPFFEGLRSVTASIEVKLKQPVMVGEKYHLNAWITKNSRRLLKTAAEVLSEDGTLMAVGKATMYVISQHPVEKA
jgi:acyl-coenzyme A thioesterase PaaI-like protein